MLVRELMTRDVITARRETKLPDVVHQMLVSGVSGLPVVDDDGRVIGVVTEADLLAREGFGHGRQRLLDGLDQLLRRRDNRWWQKAEGVAVGDLMSSPARTASPTETVRSVAARMVTMSLKRLPVVDGDGRLVGIVSQRDLLRLLHQSDDELHRTVEARLADPLYVTEDHGVTCEVDDGIVTLTGAVRSELERDGIVAAVRALPPVVDVRVDIAVTQATS